MDSKAIHYTSGHIAEENS